MPTPSPVHPRTKILAIYENHGAYVRHYGDLYFLAASDLHEQLALASFDDPAARVQAVARLIVEVELAPQPTPKGSFRFEDRDEYRRHRRSLSRALSLFRRAWRLRQKVEAAVQQRA